MRIWSLHPKYLDAKGIVALWRETLLAQKVLHENTTGYKNHPQLKRFKAHPAPIDAIGAYLLAVHQEAEQRGYHFDKTKIISPKNDILPINVTTGQLHYELAHLKQKLTLRDIKKYGQIEIILHPDAHSLFIAMEGGIEAWERK